jgi:acyl-coenzyme A thioesterase PaaI-like protein
MAALMKYVQLQHENFTELMRQADENNDTTVAKDVNKGHASPSNSSTEASNKKISSPTKSSSMASNMKLINRLEAYRGAYIALTPPDNFDTPLYESVKIVSGTTNVNGTSGTAIFSVKFSAQYCNKFGTVHGGAIATLLDGLAQCSTAVVDGDSNEVSMGPKKGKVRGGATKSLQVGYLRSIKVGEAVTIICEVLKSSGTTITIRLTATREANGEVLAICTMEKERHEKSKL